MYFLKFFKFKLILLIKFIIIVTINFFLMISILYAQSNNTKKIIIEGNNRIASETIKEIANLIDGRNYSDDELNDIVIKLNKSKYFSSINLQNLDSIVKISVVERAIINNISFEGNKSISTEVLFDIISTKKRHLLFEDQVEKDAELIALSYLNSGKLSAQITPKIIYRDKNSVDLVYEVIEGSITEIEKISFVGNKNFSNRRLQRVISSKQAGLLRKIIKSDTYLKDKIDYDKQLLRKFYLNNGFVNYDLVSSSVNTSREKDAVFITYTIQEGQQYKFGNIFTSSEIPSISLSEIDKINKIKLNDIYNPRKLDKYIDEIQIYLEKKNLNFVNIVPKFNKDEKNLSINIDLNLIQAERIFVERINIYGNSTTLDEVIRSNFDFIEGDPYNAYKVKIAMDKIRALGFFKDLRINTKQGSSEEKIIIDVNLIEQATGSFGIGAGFNSSDGAAFNFNISEKNFLGRGQKLDFSISNSKVNRNIKFGIEDSTFQGKDVLVGISFGIVEKSPTSRSLVSDNIYIKPIIGFPTSANSNLSISYNYQDIDIKKANGDLVISPIIENDVGSYKQSGVTFTYKINNTNFISNPTSGYKIKLSQEINGFGGDAKYMKTMFGLDGYSNVFRDDILLSLKFNGGVILGSGSNTTNRFNLGGDALPGFLNGGIGPVDNTITTDSSNINSLGGKMFTSLNLETSFPIGFPDEYGIFGGIFLSSGSVWSLDDTKMGEVDDQFNLRIAAGASVFWDTIIGPLRFNFSRPLKKLEYDTEENFRFTVDTRFWKWMF